jgi:biopolymer transport protein ExbD
VVSRKTKRIEEEEQDLNLAPIMNMVIILIPLLLLSVVFLQVGVINVTTPSLSPAKTSQHTEEEEEQKITVAISDKGFTVATREGVVPGCGDVTVCVREGADDLRGEFDAAAALLASGAHVKGQAAMDQALEAYDWPGLYAVLARVKRDNPAEDTIYVTADPRVPYAAIVRLFDVSRTRLSQESYDSAAAFYQAKPDADSPELFPNPIVTVAQ